MNAGHLARRMRNLVAWGTTTAAMQDAGGVATVQGRPTPLEKQDALPVLATFGLSSSPPVGSRFLAIFATGDRSKGTILGFVAAAVRRKGLLTGETVVYDNWGNEVHLSQAGITIKHATRVTIQAPTAVLIQAASVRIEGALTVTGEVTAQCDGPSVTLSGHLTRSINAPPTPHT